MATIKKVKKAADGIQKPKKPTPTYKNLRMGVNNENYSITGQNKNITPSAKDSGRYRGGFEQGLKGSKGMPNEGQVEKMGRWEGQNVGKKPKAKSGKMLKKQAATAIAMKTAGKKPKSMMKMGGKMTKMSKKK